MAMRLRQFVRPLASRMLRASPWLFPSSIILAYHRVAEPEIDPQLLCVSPGRFKEHLRVMRDLGACISLRELVQRCAIRRVPRNAIVVTFDDGYADNLANAEPLLNEAGVPATVFVATGGLDEGAPFWWDELELLLLRAEHLPSELSIEARGKRLRWDTASSADKPATDPAWNITRPTEPTERHAIYRFVMSLCSRMAADERDKVIGQLRRQIAVSARFRIGTRLTPDELSDLGESAVIEIGAHGVAHAPFGVLTSQERRRELVSSRSYLAAMTGAPVDLLSYPYGTRDDLSDDSAALARSSGFMAACVNWPDNVGWWTDPYRLPRHLVRDWSGEDFAEILEGWLGGNL